jgi:hypothetical protein
MDYHRRWNTARDFREKRGLFQPDSHFDERDRERNRADDPGFSGEWEYHDRIARHNGNSVYSRVSG